MINSLSSVVHHSLHPVLFYSCPGPSSYRAIHESYLEVYLQKCTERLQFHLISEGFRCTSLRSCLPYPRLPQDTPRCVAGRPSFYIISLYARSLLFPFLFIQRRATNSDSEGSVARVGAIIETESIFRLGVSCGNLRHRSERVRKRECREIIKSILCFSF